MGTKDVGNQIHVDFIFYNGDILNNTQYGNLVKGWHALFDHQYKLFCFRQAVNDPGNPEQANNTMSYEPGFEFVIMAFRYMVMFANIFNGRSKKPNFTNAFIISSV